MIKRKAARREQGTGNREQGLERSFNREKFGQNEAKKIDENQSR